MVIVESEEIGIIIEIRYAENGKYDTACKKAMEQIDTDGYTAELREDVFCTIIKLGIACFRKKCGVVAEKETL